jgi:hypothetical protein
MILVRAVSGLVPAAFANPPAMAVGLVTLLGIFFWLKVMD